MELLSKKIGVDLVWQSYFFHLLYWPTRCELSLKGKRQTKIKAPARWLVAINRFVARCLYCDYLLFPAKWKGTSLISVFSVNKKKSV
jgi:hypothetical protein